MVRVTVEYVCVVMDHVTIAGKHVGPVLSFGTMDPFLFKFETSYIQMHMKCCLFVSAMLS